MLTIQNSNLKACISLRGAEVQSLTLLDSGRDIIWHGDAAFWSGHAPILFPNVGNTWNGTTRHLNNEYHLPKHGFVRHREWTLVEQSSDRVTLAIENSNEDLQLFPWPFRLTVTYWLQERTLRADFTVENRHATSVMWFQLGGHPSIVLPQPLRPAQHETEGAAAFAEIPVETTVSNAPVGYLRFEGAPHSMLRASTQGCTEAQRVPIPWDNSQETVQALATNHHFNALVPLTIDTFLNEALIFDQHQVSAINVLDAQKQRIARVASSSPAWLVWAPQGKASPFICCEPWYGLPDTQEFTGNWLSRPHAQHAAPGTSWQGWYTIEL